MSYIITAKKFFEHIVVFKITIYDCTQSLTAGILASVIKILEKYCRTRGK